MGWMQPPVPRNKMPGLATKAQMAQLAAARGSELDDLFTRLMIVHHAGGIHMAAYAANHGEKKSTRDLAAAMDDGQRGEISEMNTVAHPARARRRSCRRWRVRGPAQQLERAASTRRGELA